MRRAIALLALAGILAVPALAETETPKNSLFFSLKVSYTAMSWSDYAMTTVALSGYDVEEANPIARFYVQKPAIAVSWLLISDISLHLFGDWLYKKNKTAAFIVVGVLTLARAYVMYQNIRTVQRCGR